MAPKRILGLLITVFVTILGVVGSLIQIVSFSSGLAQRYCPQQAILATFVLLALIIWFCVYLTIAVSIILLVTCPEHLESTRGSPD